MNKKILFATVVGTALEYFDFLLCAHFSLILAPLFFPESNPIVASILTLGLFAVGFIMRPIGGIIFGTIGDRVGRKRSLSASFFWIALPTLGMCLMPTYAQIGIYAPVGLLLCRMAQGLSLGGEYNNAGIFLMEHVEDNRQGFYSSILAGSGTVGSMAALGCAYLVLHSENPEVLWRIPFFFGALMAVLGYRMRQILTETPVFQRTMKMAVQSDMNTWKTILLKKKSFLIVISIGALTGILVWIPVTYTNFYLTKIVGWQTTEAIPITLVALVTYVATLPLMGMLGDRIGFRMVMLLGALSTIVMAYPMFYLLTQGYVVAAQIGFTLLASTFGSVIHALMAIMYPVTQRCRAISLGFSIGISIGGASPMVSAWLVNVTGSNLAPALYMMFVACWGLWAMLAYRPYPQEITVPLPA